MATNNSEQSTGSGLAEVLSAIPEAPLPGFDPEQIKPFDKSFKPKTERLSDPVDIARIRTRPDGLVYVPNSHYRRILTEAFGAGGWALLPVSHWTDAGAAYYEGRLYAVGRFIGQAIGEHVYKPKEGGGYSTAVESAKSDCLTRCCKDLGIFSELWDPDFVREFKAEHCVEVWVEGYPKSREEGKSNRLWRLRRDPPYDTWPWREKSGAGSGSPGDRVDNRKTNETRPAAKAPSGDPGGSAAKPQGGRSKASTGATKTPSRPFSPDDLTKVLRTKYERLSGKTYPGDFDSFCWVFGVILAATATESNETAVAQGLPVLASVVDVFFFGVFGPSCNPDEAALSVGAWLGLDPDSIERIYSGAMEGREVDIQISPEALSELSGWLESSPTEGGRPYWVAVAALLVDP